MTQRKYTKSFRKRVVEEALQPEFEGKEFLVAEKYHTRTSTLFAGWTYITNMGKWA